MLKRLPIHTGKRKRPITGACSVCTRESENLIALYGEIACEKCRKKIFARRAHLHLAREFLKP